MVILLTVVASIYLAQTIWLKLIQDEVAKTWQRNFLSSIKV